MKLLDLALDPPTPTAHQMPTCNSNPHLPEHMTLCVDTMMNVGVLTFRQALYTVVFRTVESTPSMKCTLFSP